jgi:hypothetical protein
MHLGNSKIAIFILKLVLKFGLILSKCCQDYFFYLARAKKNFSAAEMFLAMPAENLLQVLTT